MHPVIQINNVSKMYRIGQIGTGTISHDLNRWWHKFRGKSDPYSCIANTNDREEAGGEYVWALKEINLSIDRGEILGVIGPNGAGKSTLLKLLSRVTAPTHGEIKTRGRMASLLEVGTGFHPELTGRENVYLNGTILGMSRAEIRSQFDEIVAFSGCEKYIDTPVKRYSSGMYVRLAFAVAAHLNPEILIVDEVLAVGDADFQERCLGKLRDVRDQFGRTVLFVSHNMAAIRNLCGRVVLCEKGEIAFNGPVDEGVNAYLSRNIIKSDVSVRDWKNRRTTGEARVCSLSVLSEDSSTPTSIVDFRRPMRVVLDVEFFSKVNNPVFGVLIETAGGEPLVDLRSSHVTEFNAGNLKSVRIEIAVPHPNIYPGDYLLSPWIMDGCSKADIDWVKRCTHLKIIQDEKTDPVKLHPEWGKLHWESNWNFSPTHWPHESERIAS